MIHFFLEDVSFDLSLLTSVPVWVEEVVHQEHQHIYSLNYILCSDTYLLGINQQYLQHDYYTDVITFDQRDSPDDDIEGDIFISIDRVYENSREQQTVMLHELFRVMIHGALHLLGYSDEDGITQLEMRRLESHYLDLYFSRFNH